MKSTNARRLAVIALLSASVAATSGMGCEIIADFDRSKIPQVGEDASLDGSGGDTGGGDATPPVDANMMLDAPAPEGGADASGAEAGGDTGAPDGSAPDTGTDAGAGDVSVPDTGPADGSAPDTSTGNDAAGDDASDGATE